MKILVISQFFEPDITAAAFRITETCDLLRKSGHDLLVITTRPHKGTVSTGDGAQSRSWVLRASIRSYHGRGRIDYLMHYLSFLVSGLVSGYFRGRSWQPDVIWATTPPLFVGLLGVLLSKVLRAPLVLDVRDVWPDAVVAAGMLREGSLLYRLGQMMETELYVRARTITCVSKCMKEYIASKCRDTEVVLVYNGVVSSVLEGLPAHREIEERIVYAGNLGRVQGLNVLVSAFDLLIREQADGGRQLVLVGEGALKSLIIQQINNLKIRERVEILGPMPKKELLNYLGKSEILFIGLDSHPSLEITVPSKVFDYLAVGRPIVAALGGEGKDIIGRCSENYLANSSDITSIKNGFKLLIQKASPVTHIECNVDLVREEFTREYSTGVLEEVFSRAVA